MNIIIIIFYSVNKDHELNSLLGGVSSYFNGIAFTLQNPFDTVAQQVDSSVEYTS